MGIKMHSNFPRIVWNNFTATHYICANGAKCVDLAWELVTETDEHREYALILSDKVDVATVVIEDGTLARDLITYDGME